MPIQIFCSYACRDTYLAFAWLKEIQHQGISLELAWKPFALQARIYESHVQAQTCYDVFGTPMLVFANGTSYYLELSEIPPDTAALEVWKGLEALATGKSSLRQLLHFDK
ncbi:MAG: hypothetical protein Fur0022_32890 [Anaerolineales bacterium]